MISLIAVGISEYNDTNLSNINCAVNDVKLIYSTFEEEFDSVFQPLNSCCYSNLSADEFISLLKIIQTSLYGNEDQLIIYFSGHAEIKNNKLLLLFKDYDRKSHGKVNVEQIPDLFIDYNGKILLILDCCQSGKASSIASDNINTTNINVLASCNEYGFSYYTNNYSRFTFSLCNAIKKIRIQGSNCSLTALAEEIKKSGYTDIVFNMGASDRNFILYDSQFYLSKFNDFPKRFLNTLLKSDSATREALWYGLAEVPLKYNEAIFNDYFKTTNTYSMFEPESSWLIRRAIGSILSMFSDYLSIAELLCKSFYWQEQCIGLIALRYQIKEDSNTYCNINSLILNNIISKIDAIWLANLYMSDNPNYDYKVFLKTSLGHSLWGINEIYRSAEKHSIDLNSFISDLYDYGIEKKIIKEFNTTNTKSHASILSDFLLEHEERGRFPENIKSKFLLSSLYGSWRGNIIVDLKDYLVTHDRRTIIKELNDARLIQDISIKMAVFLWFSNNLEEFIKYQDGLLWGLNDPHHWVRREAIKVYSATNYDEEKIFSSIKNLDFDKYPGALDLLQVCPSKYIKEMLSILEVNDSFPTSDIKSLLFFFERNKI